MDITGKAINGGRITKLTGIAATQVSSGAIARSRAVAGASQRSRTSTRTCRPLGRAAALRSAALAAALAAARYTPPAVGAVHGDWDHSTLRAALFKLNC